MSETPGHIAPRDAATSQQPAATRASGVARRDKEPGATLDASQLEHIYGTIIDWVKFSDVKAGFVLSANALLIAALSTTMPTLLASGLGFSNPREAAFTALALTVALTISFSVILAIASIIPRLEASGAPPSHLYFSHLAQQAKESRSAEDPAGVLQVARDLRTLSPGRYRQELSEQVVINAAICRRKYDAIVWSLRFFLAAVLSTLLLLLFSVAATPGAGP